MRPVSREGPVGLLLQVSAEVVSADQVHTMLQGGEVGLLSEVRAAQVQAGEVRPL
jgi:hypothetical protein